MIHAIVKAVACSLQTDGEALLWKTKSTEFIKHIEIELVSKKGPHSCWLALVALEYTLTEGRGERGGER